MYRNTDIPVLCSECQQMHCEDDSETTEKGINSKLYNSSQLHKREGLGRAGDPSPLFTMMYSHWVVPDEASSSLLLLLQYIL